MNKAKKEKDQLKQNKQERYKNVKPPAPKQDFIQKGTITFDDIREQLYNTYDNMSLSAKNLGIDTQTLYNLINKYDEIKNVREEAKEKRKSELRETAIQSLISVASANNLDGMNIKGLISAKVQASEKLLKYTGDLVDKVQSTNTNLNVESDMTNLSHLSDEELDRKMKEYKSIEKALKSE